MRMRPVKLAAALLGCLVLAAGPSHAQEPGPAHMAAARELVVATGAGSSIDNIFPALITEIRQQAITRPEIAKDLDEVVKALQPELETQKQQAMNLAARAYAKWLTEAEVRDALTFFKSPSGMKYVMVQPDLTDDIVQSVTAWSQLASDYVMARTRAEMMKRGHQMQ
ncbi:DUF2059 domain-containing protein [uncultured Enterovirga sp.]|uniref:DUF2059 domain-containing protein n=1 Tax=uncultured Enterovirga sp. TaxID=2026352 RepID=UPI0035CCA233